MLQIPQLRKVSQPWQLAGQTPDPLLPRKLEAPILIVDSPKSKSPNSRPEDSQDAHEFDETKPPPCKMRRSCHPVAEQSPCSLARAHKSSAHRQVLLP